MFWRLPFESCGAFDRFDLCNYWVSPAKNMVANRQLAIANPDNTMERGRHWSTWNPRRDPDSERILLGKLKCQEKSFTDVDRNLLRKVVRTLYHLLAGDNFLTGPMTGFWQPSLFSWNGKQNYCSAILWYDQLFLEKGIIWSRLELFCVINIDHIGENVF